MGGKLSFTMAPMKKATASKAMTKGAIAEAIAASCELKKSVCAKALNVLAEVATKEVKRLACLLFQACAGSRRAPSQPQKQESGKSLVKSSWSKLSQPGRLSKRTQLLL